MVELKSSPGLKIVHVNFGDGDVTEDFLRMTQMAGIMRPDTNIVLASLVSVNYLKER